MKCKCEKNCIQKKEDILKDINTLYKPCPECHKKGLKKAIPLKQQIKLDKLDKNYKRCPQCHKRHIDYVMAHILKILIQNNQITPDASIRKLGTPLITPALNLDYLPILSKKTLVIITNNTDKQTAQEILEEVPEVKAVIKGNTKEIVGQITENVKPQTYNLMAGCDIRCDIQNNLDTTICIYKEQSKIHIEYPRTNSPKLQEVDDILSQYENPVILDAMCGVGTLGIYALNKNAKKVIFNDIYNTAIDNLKTNLQVNNISPDRYEIHNQNILELAENIKEEVDIVLLDAFLEVDTTEYANVLKKIGKDVVII